MSTSTGMPDSSLNSLTEVLASVFMRARELEALSPGDLPGIRLRQAVQIRRAQMDFQRFRDDLASELSNLQTALRDALSVAIDARTSEDPFSIVDQISTAQTKRSTISRAALPPQYRRPAIAARKERAVGASARRRVPVNSLTFAEESRLSENHVQVCSGLLLTLSAEGLWPRKPRT